jgi:hypothetical protein
MAPAAGPEMSKKPDCSAALHPRQSTVFDGTGAISGDTADCWLRQGFDAP